VRRVLLVALTLAIAGGVFVAVRPPDAAPTAERQEVVVLLHGLYRTSRSMKPLARYLERRGYTVVNLDYPSTELPLDELVGRLDAQLRACCPPSAGRLHFVTHSMGGILVRAYLRSHHPPHLGRVVMLSPPNQGTPVVDEFAGTRVFRESAGPSARELGTSPGSAPSSLGPVDFELGVITGDRSLNPYFSWLIPGRDDGTVPVEAAKVEGMRAFLVMPHTHTFIMRSPEVMKEVVHFLETGTFSDRVGSR